MVADQRERAKALGKDYRTTKEILAEIVGARSRGFEVVTFTGGEPTLRSDLPLLARFAVSLGLVVGIQTNARVLSLEGPRQALCGFGLRFVVAIHGPNAEIHDRITRAPGSFEQTLAGLRGLVAKQEKVTGKVVITRINVQALPDISNLLLDCGVHRVNFTFPHGLGNAKKDYEGIVPRFSEVMPYLIEAAERFAAGKGEVTTEAIPLCVLGDLGHLASEHHYREYVTSEVRQLDQGPRDWSADRVLEGKGKAVSCEKCPVAKACEGVWKEYLEHYGADELFPPKM